MKKIAYQLKRNKPLRRLKRRYNLKKSKKSQPLKEKARLISKRMPRKKSLRKNRKSKENLRLLFKDSHSMPSMVISGISSAHAVIFLMLKWFLDLMENQKASHSLNSQPSLPSIKLLNLMELTTWVDPFESKKLEEITRNKNEEEMLVEMPEETHHQLEVPTSKLPLSSSVDFLTIPQLIPWRSSSLLPEKSNQPELSPIKSQAR